MKNTFVLDRSAIEPILTNFPSFGILTNNSYFSESHIYCLLLTDKEYLREILNQIHFN